MSSGRPGPISPSHHPGVGWPTPAGPATWLQRLLCLPAAVLLLYLQPVTVGIGLAFLAAAVTANLITRNRSARPVGEPS